MHMFTLKIKLMLHSSTHTHTHTHEYIHIIRRYTFVYLPLDLSGTPVQTEALATYVSIARLAMSMDEIERKPLPDAVGIHTNASDSRTDRQKEYFEEDAGAYSYNTIEL